MNEMPAANMVATNQNAIMIDAAGGGENLAARSSHGLP